MSVLREFFLVLVSGLVAFLGADVRIDAGVGDPQVRTDHPWYAGELSCSSWKQLFETQATLYERVVGRRPKTDEEKALASWLWRTTHYWHGEPGVENLWGHGFRNDTDHATRDYWTGLFSHGFALCGTTHAQWTAEMQQLLGHNSARVVGVQGHNSFEVFLKGGPYGQGRWSLLDHDVCTVVFDKDGRRLLSIEEIFKDTQRWLPSTSASARPQQHGWPISGLHPQDGKAFRQYRSAEYLSGYAGPPPMVHLRRGETFRRYLNPGLHDGRTFVFWGRNYSVGGILGPERSRTWVNQPQRLYRTTTDCGHRDGQARFANAIFTYRPDFATNDYREAVWDESSEHVTFHFRSPYVIAASPPGDTPWGIYESGCRHGLVVRGNTSATMTVSVDLGASWSQPVVLQNGVADLTDAVKGHRQYLLKFAAGANALAKANVQTVTVCQVNSSTIPQLTDKGCRVQFAASGHSVLSAGPNLGQARPCVVAGDFDTPRVTLELAPPAGFKAHALHAAAHVASSNPPSPEVAYQIEFSTDQGMHWRPLVEDWRITRRGQEPADFWSQSFCWGQTRFAATAQPVQVRFRNNGGKRYRRAELHLVHDTGPQDGTRVTFCWQDDRGEQQASHTFAKNRGARAEGDAFALWTVPTGRNVKTRWVQYEPVVPAVE